MKLLMAVSDDGFFALGPKDLMKWTGPSDKAVFRLLTLADSHNPLLVGSATAALLPPLKDRHVIKITRAPNKEAPDEMTLEFAAWCYPEAWVIGGPTLALAALKAGLIDKAFMCVSPAQLNEGISSQEVLAYLPQEEAAQTVKLEGVEVKVFLRRQRWPGK